ncbi:hypothetical protein ENKNEFLB_00437 [Nocardioides aquaticus]|uniref:Immunity protein 26 n=1 Tax=Nocardioides aquaticus TaxID=160826 RepID=A0ABX8EDT1_9ACTN|nr:Imm26 family immunity protein [Nocardioides aquaticus]QVT78065.1 hypothetical protein ENKNEFLB_00437 [Nocardioides aquaticus]
MSQQVDEGDMFSIPLGDGRCGFGQVVATYRKKGVYYVAVFDKIVDEAVVEESAEEARASRLLFLALTLDSRLHHGMWRVIGPRDIAADLPFPAYKVDVGFPPVPHVVDHLGERTRPATADEVALLPVRTTVAPVALERALQARAGLAPWTERFDGFAPDEDLTTDRFFG